MIFLITWWRELLIAALFASCWFLAHELKVTVREKAVIVAQIEAQKREAAALLAKLTADVKAKDAALKVSNGKLEAQNAKRTKDIAAAVSAAKRDFAGGLRDPGGCRSSSPSPAAENSAAPVPATAAAEGRLSPELTQFLIGEAGRADEIAAYAQSCYAFAQSVKSP